MKNNFVFGIFVFVFTFSYRLHAATQCRLLGALEVAVESHVSNSAVTPDLTKEMIELFPSVLDPNKLFLTQSDFQSLTQMSAKDISTLHKKTLAEDFAPFESLMDRYKASVKEVIVFLDQMKNRREVIIELAGRMGSDPEKKPDFANSVAERNDQVLRAFARVYLSGIKIGLPSEEAYVQAVRYMSRLLESSMKLNEGTAEQLVFKAYLRTLDPHSDLLLGREKARFQKLNSSSDVGIGAMLREMTAGYQVTVLKGGPADLAGLKDGDVVTHVDGQIVRRMDPDNVVKKIVGADGTPVVLKVRRGPEILDLRIVRATLNLNSTQTTSKILDSDSGKLGVVKIGSFYNGMTQDVVGQINGMAKSENLRGLILDLRGNGGGLLNEAVSLSALFLSGEGLPIYGMKHKDQIQYAGINVPRALWRGPLVVLVDYESASASELFSGAMKDHGRAIIVGTTQTLGKGSAQNFPFSQIVEGGEVLGGVAKVTFAIYYNPSGQSPQGVGVKPDVVLPDLRESHNLEKDRPHVLVASPIQPAIAVEPESESGRNKVLGQLKIASKERVEADGRWKAAQTDAAATPKDQDLYLEEAGRILSDLLKAMGVQ